MFSDIFQFSVGNYKYVVSGVSSGIFSFLVMPLIIVVLLIVEISSFNKNGNQ